MFFHLLQINQRFFISIIFRTRNKSAGMIFRAQDESALQIYKQTGMYNAACFEQTCVLAPVKWILGFSCGCECWLFAVIYCDKKRKFVRPTPRSFFCLFFCWSNCQYRRVLPASSNLLIIAQLFIQFLHSVIENHAIIGFNGCHCRHQASSSAGA